MPRRKPFSTKQKKEQLKDKRAVKRGDLDPSDVRIAALSNRPERRPHHARNANGSGSGSGSGLGSTRLQSKFTALTPEYLARTRDLAHAIPLPRPIPDDYACFPLEWMERDRGRLTCPGRPKFRYDQTKKEVERNEEGVFAKWLKDTRTFVEEWVAEEDEDRALVSGSGEGGTGTPSDSPTATPDSVDVQWRRLRSPTWFETNLEVWRQLWRVTESSHILLLLADARCPPLHLPPSLRAYVQALKPRKEVVLVLTKSDLVDPDALSGWKAWAKAWWAQGFKAAEAKDGKRKSRDGAESSRRAEEGEVQVITLHSYDTAALYGDKPKHKPALPDSSMRELSTALQTAHARLRTPPDRVRSDPERLKTWRPPVRSHVDWDGLNVRATMDSDRDKGAVLISVADSSTDGTPPTPANSDHVVEDEPLTIGLIGQPNVGKSSLLNAIMGESRVRASKTPGKTKHFQTLFWGRNKEIKIVDCPGLVCPSLVGMEIQALCGTRSSMLNLTVLPISQIPSLPACILSAAHLLPMEQIFRVPAVPSSPTDSYAHKRTWRTPPADVQPSQEGMRWTAGGIMEARALDRGYLTAKGGRPDGNRAANGMMRSLADGRVRWCFFPPGSQARRDGKGIWLGDFIGDVDDDDEKHDEDSDGDTDRENHVAALDTVKRPTGSDVDGEDDSEDDGEASEAERTAREIDRGFFAALVVEDGDSEDDDGQAAGDG